MDEHTGNGLSYANVFVHETKTGAVTDTTGFFELRNICQGSYHIIFSHVGCKTLKNTFIVEKDTNILVFLDHHQERIDEVVVYGRNNDKTSQIKNILNSEDIVAEGNKDLASMIGTIQGVSILRTGSGISKPVIHGLFGNRVTILNNGVIQSGQQWGNDHAPEIDPLMANNITVIKGAGALAYGGNSSGGAVLVESGNIPEISHINGEVNYIFQTNGLGHTLNTRIGKFDKWAAWRVTGTLKSMGDMKSADYYLTNTGKKEANFAIELEKKYSEKWNTGLYYSLYSANIGILRGSHIGNTTDLEQAIVREEPFFTSDIFSYTIEAPRQNVQHHLMKMETKYLFSDNQFFAFTYGGQLNNRKEFDVRRSGRSDIPALSLLQNTQFFEGIHSKSFVNSAITIKSGLQFTFTDNTNNPETEILPLIPDYRSYQEAGFFLFKKEQKRVIFETGARYEIESLDVTRISITLPRKIERFDRLFQNYSVSTGIAFKPSKSFKTTFDAGYVLRAPEINELYSFGLHQGVSGIEEGNAGLKTEKSLKLLLSADWNLNEKLVFQALGYYQNIQDFIYLQPLQEFRLTIRGAFPVFCYQQTNAVLYGSDMFFSYNPVKRLKLETKFAIVKAQNKSENIPLINIPATNLSYTVFYLIKDHKIFKSNSVSLSGKNVFKQNNILPEQDFTEPPDAYFLLNFSASTRILLSGISGLKLALNIENILNEKYRDYLNRQRYFADDLGINVILRINYDF